MSATRKSPAQSPGLRLQKLLAAAGVASRRRCEQLIEQGHVFVNGRRVTQLPVFIDPERDRIEVDGQTVSEPAGGEKSKRATRQTHTTIMLNKPRHVICTASDPQQRKTVLDLVPLEQRLFPVGRLDADSTGLILLTDDGELAQHLTHPSYEVPKQYRVSVRGRISDDDVEKLRRGLYLAPAPGNKKRTTVAGKSRAAVKAAAEQVRVLRRFTDRTRGDGTELAITLREGRNREIRRMLARLGFKVRRLHRIAVGPLQLKGLAVGQWRRLTPLELGKLRKAAGM
ncbi:MAG: rRNA pseudouridine synthase [Phycisphaeraceae bacterium]|nr:rRNA pseudouridine synthase [Phycisphaeraceae bacterium]